ncbi:MAG: VanZ family protein [Planctomycetota bacterium]
MPAPDTDTPTPNRLFVFAMRLALAVYWFTLAAMTHWPSLSIIETPIRAADDPYRLMQQDKPAHLLVFGGLTVLLILARPLGRHRSPKAHALFAGGVALAYAVIDETTQGFSIDRTVSHSDLLANFLGVVGVTLLALTPNRDPKQTAWIHWDALIRLIGYLGAFAVGGALLAITRTVGRETYVLHAVIAAAITLALLRSAPVVPRLPRLTALLICLGVITTVALGELAQGFSGMLFSQSEVLNGELGVLIAMLLWLARLASTDGAAQQQHPPTDDEHELRDKAKTDAAPAPPHRV